MLAVVQEQDRDDSHAGSEKSGLPVVYLFSAGGFLGRRNATLLIGLREGMEEDTVQDPAGDLQTAHRIPDPAPGRFASSHADACPGDRGRRDHFRPAGGTFRGNMIRPGRRSKRSHDCSRRVIMKMIILIVKDNDADEITQALTADKYRVTRVASTGGFLRSGVVTLLIGVRDERAELVQELIRSNCRPCPRRKTRHVVRRPGGTFRAGVSGNKTLSGKVIPEARRQDGIRFRVSVLYEIKRGFDDEKNTGHLPDSSFLLPCDPGLRTAVCRGRRGAILLPTRWRPWLRPRSRRLPRFGSDEATSEPGSSSSAPARPVLPEELTAPGLTQVFRRTGTAKRKRN
jgi:uncharacterized protein YaaQ